MWWFFISVKRGLAKLIIVTVWYITELKKVCKLVDVFDKKVMVTLGNLDTKRFRFGSV